MRYRILLSTAAVAALVAGAAVHASADPNPPVTDPIDARLLTEALHEMHDAGAPAVIAEVRAGDETWTGAAGERVPGGGETPQPTDRVRIASITKSMVSTVVLQLVDEGRITLDDEVADVLPGVLPYDDPITVRQLLNNTSGVGDYFTDIYPSMADGSAADLPAHKTDAFTPDELVAMGTDGPLAFPPGSGFEYANTNYVVIGLLIEELTGQSLSDVLSQRILTPLGMSDSYLGGDDPVIAGPHPNAYVATGVDGEPPIDTTDLSPSQFWAAGAMISNPHDVNTFFRAMSDGTLLSPDLLGEARDFTDESGGFYGLGLETFQPMPDECGPIPEGVAYGNTGGGLGYQSASFHSPDGSRQITITWTLDIQLAPSDALNQGYVDAIWGGLCAMKWDGPASTAPQANPASAPAVPAGTGRT